MEENSFFNHSKKKKALLLAFCLLKQQNANVRIYTMPDYFTNRQGHCVWLSVALFSMLLLSTKLT